MATAQLIEPLVSNASGSVGGLTFGRNQFGPWTRTRGVPTDPATIRQLAMRIILSTLVARWQTGLTQTERDAWDRYALAVPLPGRIGRPNNAGGLQMYIRSNAPRLQTASPALPRVDLPPIDHNIGPFTPVPRVVLNIVDKTFHPFFDNTDDWATEPAAGMIFWASAPVPTTRNFHKGPYQIAGQILGRVSPPHEVPATLQVPQPAIPPNRLFVRGRVTRADARLSGSFRLTADIVPQVPPVPVSALFTPLGFPFALATITFDAQIRRQPHLTGNWTVRFSDTRYLVTAAATFDGGIRLSLRNVALEISPDFVDYAPPPFDVNGILTGLPVAAFNIPLV